MYLLMFEGKALFGRDVDDVVLLATGGVYLPPALLDGYCVVENTTL